MVFKIIWSAEAYNTFLQNIDYLKFNWNDKEIGKFTTAISKVFLRIKSHPESYPASLKHPEIRKAKINYNEKLNELGLVTFWNIKQDPKK